MLAAQVPVQPDAPTTTWSPDDVVVSWVEPDSGGSPIIGYIIRFVMSDGVSYATEPNNCDQSSSTATTCTVPVTALKAAPF